MFHSFETLSIKEEDTMEHWVALDGGGVPAMRRRGGACHVPGERQADWQDCEEEAHQAQACGRPGHALTKPPSCPLEDRSPLLLMAAESARCRRRGTHVDVDAGPPASACVARPGGGATQSRTIGAVSVD
eukprot:5349913-Prymnesium_polylepis.1